MATFLCSLLYWWHRTGTVQIPLLDRLDLDSIDAMFRIRGERAPAGETIVIVGLDEKSRREVPQLFQMRTEHARLVDALASYEPLAVGIDALYSSPEINLPAEVVKRVKDAAALLGGKTEPKTAEEIAALSALDGVIKATSGDAQLAAAVKRAGMVYLGALFFLEQGEADPADPSAPERIGLRGARYREAAVVEQPHDRRPPRAEAYALVPQDIVADGARGAGALNVAVDNDGDVRRIYSVIEHGGRYYMPMGLALAAAALPRGSELSYVTSESFITFGEDELEVDARGIAQLAFLGPVRTFPHISAVDVLEKRVPKEALAGKLVFVGRTDKAQDTYATPFDPLMPGVEIHATLAHNAIYGELLRKSSPFTTLFTILILGALLSSLQLRVVRGQRSWYVGVGGLLTVMAYMIAMQLAFAKFDVILEFAAPFLSVAIITLAALTTSLATEGREKAQLRAAFSQYVQKTVVDRLLEDPDRARLGGVRRDLTVLFSDIRGFSKFSEGLDPQALSELLNDYLTPMTNLVMNEGGMLDKYIGDAVMAVYGAPLEQADHAARACRTALQMQHELKSLNETFRERGLPAIVIGIGVNSGPMSVGNMGSEARFDYTVLGDAVNLGARLEAITKDYKAGIIVGEHTRDLVGDEFVFRELDLVKVTGRDGTARIYELIGEAGQTSFSAGDLATFGRGLEAYRQADWTRAESEFKAFAAKHPVDGPAHVFLARVEDLKAHPPESWDGIYAQRGK